MISINLSLLRVRKLRRSLPNAARASAGGQLGGWRAHPLGIVLDSREAAALLLPEQPENKILRTFDPVRVRKRSVAQNQGLKKQMVPRGGT